MARSFASARRFAQARGCRLDPGLLGQAVTEASLRLMGADLLIVNTFGKLEAQGRGFVSLIVRAQETDMAVIVGVKMAELA